MRDREPTIVTLLVLLMLTVWLGFLVHRSPLFAGSFFGGMLGVGGTILMLFPLAGYSVAKRVQGIKRRVTGWVSMRTLLATHIYTALCGSILVIAHTGHKFDSPLGIALTATVLLVVSSGFIGRYLMSHISQGLREKQQTLSGLRSNFDQTSRDLGRRKPEDAMARSESDYPAEWDGDSNRTGDSVSTVNSLAGAVADLEYSIAIHDWVKNSFKKWLRFHLAISGVLCSLLAMHIWSAVYYGLRWFR